MRELFISQQNMGELSPEYISALVCAGQDALGRCDGDFPYLWSAL
jgi:hypothetical protein